MHLELSKKKKNRSEMPSLKGKLKIGEFEYQSTNLLAMKRRDKKDVWMLSTSHS
jgi:hypothetical protein